MRNRLNAGDVALVVQIANPLCAIFLFNQRLPRQFIHEE